MSFSEIKIDNSLLLFSISWKTSNEMPELFKVISQLCSEHSYMPLCVCVCDFSTIYICSS